MSKLMIVLISLFVALSPCAFAASDTEAEIKFSASNTVIVGEADAADTQIRFDGNAQDFHIGLDDSADDLVIGLGSALGTTPALSVDENQVVTVHQDPIFAGTTPKVTIGDAGAEDSQVTFDGNAADFSIGIDDTNDSLVMSLGSALGTTDILAADGTTVTVTDNVDINGTLTTGSGTAITEIYFGTDAIVSGQTSKATTITGLSANAVCTVSPGEDPTTDVYILAVVETANTLTVTSSADPSTNGLDYNYICME